MRTKSILNFLTLAVVSMLSACLIAQAQDAVRMPEMEARKAIVTRVDPAYPPAARQLKIAGRVQMDAVVDTDGNVERVQAVSGNPILTSAAGAALKKWKFTPFTSGGKPVKAIAGFFFDFKL